MADWRTNTPEKFWRRIEITGPDDCWGWQGTTNAYGHGRLTYENTWWVASRLAWALTNGPIPDGLCVLHRCDNPPCCNPAHLFLGTRADNTTDMMTKGRNHWLQRDHCKNGHAFAVHGRIVTRATGKQYRCCLMCKADEQRRRRARMIGV